MPACHPAQVGLRSWAAGMMLVVWAARPSVPCIGTSGIFACLHLPLHTVHGDSSKASYLQRVSMAELQIDNLLLLHAGLAPLQS